jgi:phosphoglycerate dehydrogenase-like enzyme
VARGSYRESRFEAAVVWSLPVNVVVVGSAFGRDLSFISDVDEQIRVLVSDGADDNVLADADVVLVGYPVPAVVASKAPRLRWAHHIAAGVSNLHNSDLWTSDVVLTSSRGAVGATAIAEYAIAGVLHFARGLHEAMRQRHVGEFTRRGYDLRPVAGSTIGVIGLGGIGKEVARLAHALGMRVIATRRSVTEPAFDVDGADIVLPADRLLQVAADSDFLVVCSQLTEETRSMIGASVLAAMPSHAVLINIARGEEVDEDELIAALSEGRIRGAVLDVHAGESTGTPPRPDLLALPQVLITPHLSGSGDPWHGEPQKDLFVDNLRRFLTGETLRNVVDRARGY